MPGIVVVGSGLAGYNLVREIRRIHSKIPVTLITADTGDSYSKPMLSGAFSQKQSPDDLLLASMDSQAKFLGIKILANTAVEEILPDQNMVLCSGKKRIPYENLVLATGAAPLQVPVLGKAVSKIHSVNSLEQFRRWYASVSALPLGSSILIIGAGHVAIEFASELLSLGMVPHLVSPDARPLESILPLPVADDVLAGLSLSGFEFHLGCSVVSVESTSKTKLQVVLSDGSELLVGAVLSAVGMEPNIELAEQAGLATRRGVLVDRSMQTSLRGVYALGDVAEVEGIYMPYVAPLIQEAKVLASVLLGQRTELNMKPPVIQIKCPFHPMVSCPVWQGGKGVWEYVVDSHGTAAYHRDDSGMLTGFALTREHLAEKMLLLNSMAMLWD